MDILSRSTPEPPLRAMGRDTAQTIATKPDWEQRIAAAPHVFSGASDSMEVSPPTWLYCPAGWDNQDIGMCVGKGTKNGASTILRIPEKCVFDPNDLSKCSKPLKNIRLSGLFSYWLARNVNGRSGFRDGAVVAYSMDGLQKRGLILESSWPDTAKNQAAYSDGRPPTEAMFAEGLTHIVVHCARITSRKQYFDYMAQGFPIIDGVPIGSGWMQTGEDGRFSLGGRNVGGHCTLSVQYDRKKNRMYKRNSWQRWGARTDNPEFRSDDPSYGGNAGGYSNVGWCPLDEYEDNHLSDRAFQSGETDAFVVNDVPGFEKPKIVPISNVEVFI